MSRRGLLLPLLAFLLLSLGCAAAPPKKDYTAFRAADPRSILVVPVVNNTTNVEAPGLFLSTLPIPIAERGYYVFPVNMVKRVLDDEGLSDPNLVHGADTARLCNLFGADAVLYVSIEAWTAKYILINTEVIVEFDYVMKDGKTGDTIWKERRKVVSNSSEGAQDPLSPLVMAVIRKAYPNYMPLARSANSWVFTAPGIGLPAGPRNKDYGKPAGSGK
ncbi:MAG: hypothetical protein H6Q81_2378 [Deltaproteobacteria bacterium]|nr:hypothetical protein [Deltaproteobacteria bacterium]